MYTYIHVTIRLQLPPVLGQYSISTCSYTTKVSSCYRIDVSSYYIFEDALLLQERAGYLLLQSKDCLLLQDRCVYMLLHILEMLPSYSITGQSCLPVTLL
jgi:hypothetical protein